MRVSHTESTYKQGFVDFEEYSLGGLQLDECAVVSGDRDRYIKLNSTFR